MKARHVRDLLLVAAVVAIAVAAVVPSRAPDREPVAADRGDAPKEEPPEPPAQEARGAPTPAVTAFPIAAGATWVYHVEGPEELVPSDRWTLEVRALPEGDAPGEVAVGFGAERSSHPFWIEGGAVRLAALPFVEPLELSGPKPGAIEGFLVPPRRGLGDGAAWSQSFARSGEHEMTDAKGRTERVAVRGTQIDRALAGELADVTVPAGTFPARRIDWTARVELFVGKRPVLDPLTAKPFRTEILWVSEGVGIVRRRVEHAIPDETVVTFDLVSYTVPPPAGGI
ncbi:MAG: hypothetical protein M0R80_06090 [Proteobacteria bacterium]|jgi:hypothetical protein|nr:hypothetical protein [Pseudomonadota bacterium]